MENAKKGLGIYIHIPFCVSKCIYCDFLSFKADDETKEKYVKALCNEIEAFTLPASYRYEEVCSVFFGGGTPSILDSRLIVAIINKLREKFTFSEDCEITVECNPGTLSAEKLSTYKWAGVNRLSIGLQSPDDRELKNLGRIHTYNQFLDSYIDARQAGFSNINIDLMSAIPFQTVESYKRNLRTVLALKPEHISAYSLIVEEGTPLYNMVNNSRRSILPSEDEEREMYAVTGQILRENGYVRYEISNYAREGYECIHNIGYWTGRAYIGFGISAASYLGDHRWTNTGDMKSYLENPVGNYSESHILSVEDMMEEFMFLGLRMMKGVSLTEFERRFGTDFYKVYGDIAQKQQKKGLVKLCDDYLSLTDLGIDVSNDVMSDYILTV